MRLNSTFTLILWLASLGAPLLAQTADECQQICCADLETSCPMEQEVNDCPFIAVSDPLPGASALPARTIPKAAGLAVAATTLPVVPIVRQYVAGFQTLLPPPPLAARLSPLLI